MQPFGVRAEAHAGCSKATIARGSPTGTRTDICVVRGASGARPRGASGGRSVPPLPRLQPTSPWPQTLPMHFLSLTEYNVGLS
eukprot:4926233-Prymnesium_polylepis.1